MTSVIATVATALGVPDWFVRERRAGELVLETDAEALPVLADRAALGLNARLMSLFASDERNTSGCFLVHHVWSLWNLRTFLHIVAPVDPAQPTYASIAAKHGAPQGLSGRPYGASGVG